MHKRQVKRAAQISYWFSSIGFQPQFPCEIEHKQHLGLQLKMNAPCCDSGGTIIHSKMEYSDPERRKSRHTAQTQEGEQENQPKPRYKKRQYGSLAFQMEPSAVAKRNERERNRVRLVNDGFSCLRQHIPYFPDKKKLSKVETLRYAVAYIKHLQDMINEHDATSTGGGRAAKHGAESKPQWVPSWQRTLPGNVQKITIFCPWWFWADYRLGFVRAIRPPLRNSLQQVARLHTWDRRTRNETRRRIQLKESQLTSSPSISLDVTGAIGSEISGTDWNGSDFFTIARCIFFFQFVRTTSIHYW